MWLIPAALMRLSSLKPRRRRPVTDQMTTLSLRDILCAAHRPAMSANSKQLGANLNVFPRRPPPTKLAGALRATRVHISTAFPCYFF